MIRPFKPAYAVLDLPQLCGYHLQPFLSCFPNTVLLRSARKQPQTVLDIAL